MAEAGYAILSGGAICAVVEQGACEGFGGGDRGGQRKNGLRGRTIDPLVNRRGASEREATGEAAEVVDAGGGRIERECVGWSEERAAHIGRNEIGSCAEDAVDAIRARRYRNVFEMFREDARCGLCEWKARLK